MMNIAVIETPTDLRLVEHAEAIRVLGKRAVGDIIEIGKRLKEAKDLCGHGGWLPWLEQEFGWKEQTARNFMQAHDLASKSLKFGDLDLNVSALYLLAAPSTPEDVRDEIITKAAGGEKLTHAQVKKMIADAKREGAAEAEDAAKRRLADAEAAIEKKITKATEALNWKVAELEADLLGAITPGQVKEAIAETVQPLKDKIKRLQDEKDKQRETASRLEQDPHGLAATRIATALQSLVEGLSIRPEDVIEAQRYITRVTGQSMRAGLAPRISDAERAHAWLARFLEQAREVEE